MEGLERSDRPGMEPLQLRTPPPPRRPSVSGVSRATTGWRSRGLGVYVRDCRTAADSEVVRGSALAALPAVDGEQCIVPAVRRAYSFFSSASCRTLIPSIASAYIFLSSPFSFSRALRRLASATSIIPYFLRHRCRVATDICFC